MKRSAALPTVALIRGQDDPPYWVSDYREAVNPAWLDVLDQLKLPTHFVRAAGLHLWTADGNVLHDMVAGFGSAIFGHAPQDLLSQLNVSMAAELPNVLVYGAQPLAAGVARDLLARARGTLSKVHFCNDGSQAIDAALKFAAISTQRREFIGMKGGFHGLSVGATFLAGGGPWLQSLPQVGPRVHRLSAGDWPEIERRLARRKTAAVVIEIVQGTGAAPYWGRCELLQLQALCRESGTLLIVDEVMTGLGRTGGWFAFHEGGRAFKPDLVTLSKSLSAGLMPVAAVLMTQAVYEAVFAPPGRAKIHGSTFSGHRLGLVLADAVLRRLQAEQRIEHVLRVGKLLSRRLTRLAEQNLISPPVGRGLLQAFAPLPPRRRMTSGECGFQCFAGLLSRGWVTLPSAHAPGHLRVMPPFTIEAEKISAFVDALEDTLRDAATWKH